MKINKIPKTLTVHWKLPKTELSGKHSLIWEISLNRSLMIQFKCIEDTVLQVGYHL